MAGVSKSTVSRILNNGKCSEESKEAVLQAVKELNYTPSYFARNIRTRKSMTIAMMIPDASNLFYTEMFKAVEKYVLAVDYMVILCDTQNSPEYEIKYADKLLNRHIDGLIYFTYTVHPKTEKYFTKLSSKIPVVFMDFAFAHIDNISMVATNGFESTRTAVKTLYESGKRRISYINFPKDANITLPRYKGYIQGLKDCGLPFNEEYVYYSQSEPEFNAQNIGYKGAKELLNAKELPDAIMVAADPLAVGALRYLKEKNINIPGDISVIGFDNNNICEIVQPSLSTIAQPIKELGCTAAKIILDKINGSTSDERIIYDCEFIRRETT